MCLGLFHVMFAALPPRSLSGCLPGSCNGGATTLNSPSHKVMDFSVFEHDWRDYKTFLDILKLKMLHILKLDRWFFVADTYLDYRIVFRTGFGDVMNFFHGLNGLTRVSRHLSAAEGGVSLMEAAHSQHVSLLSQRIKLAYILSATRINHYLPLYKPAVERSTLCTVHFPQN